MQAEIYEYLFFIENEYVTVYQFLKGKKKFEYLKRDGSVSYPITKDFWEWWKRASDYVEEVDKLDFCFIYDTDNILISDPFLKNMDMVAEKSCWDKEAVKSFFNEMVENTHIELCLPDGKVESFDKENQLFGGALNVKKKFFTNIEIESSNDSVVMDKNGISPFALYFQELRRREKDN